jgi:hypothetical protein
VPAFKEYGLAELRAATKGFSTDLIVSESGEKAPNVVYKGRLDGGRFIAVKRFSKQSWPDPQQFVVSKHGTGRKEKKKEELVLACHLSLVWLGCSYFAPLFMFHNLSHSSIKRGGGVNLKVK